MVTAITPPGATMRGLKSRREIVVGDQIEEEDGGIEIEYVGAPAPGELGYVWRLSGSPNVPPAVKVEV